jgi:hypothetical protein
VVTRTVLLHLFGAIILTSAPPAIAAPPVSPLSVTMCQLAKHQSTYDGKLISVDARVETDAIEHTFGADAGDGTDCAVLLHYDPPANDRIEQFSNAVTKAHHTSTESRLLFVYARLVGIFHRDPTGTCMASIEVSDVGPFKIAPGASMVPPPPPPPWRRPANR